MDEGTAYVTLGIDETTSQDEARVIYRRRLRLLHPDLHGAQDPQLQLEAERATRQLSAAWQALQQRWSVQADQAGRPVSSMAGAGTRAGSPPAGGPAAASGAGTRPPPPRPTPPGLDECAECGGAPIRRARLRAVYRGRTALTDERCCRRCGLNAFREAQAVTVTHGWWSPVGPLRVLRAVLGNLRAWWRWRALDDVLPPLRPVVTAVTAPAEMVRPVLRRPVPATLAALLTAVVVAAAATTGVALAGGGDPDTAPSLTGHASNTAVPRDTGTSGQPTTAPTSPTGAAGPTGAAAPIDAAALPGCSSVCHVARHLTVTVGGRHAELLLVSTAAGRPVRALRFYLVRSADGTVLWSGPSSPMQAYVSKRVGVYQGSVLRQDATGHVFVDLLTSPSTSFMAVLDLGNGTDVRDFGSLEPGTSGRYRFGSKTPAVSTVDVDGAGIDDIVMPRVDAAGTHYDLVRWDGSNYVPRGCAAALVDGGFGAIRPLGTCP